MLDPIEADIMRAVRKIYEQHKGDRAEYQKAAEALADGKQMPPTIRQTFVDMCLQVYEEMEK